MSEELPDDVHEELVRLCAIGDKLVDDGSFDEAIATYTCAWRLLPEPKHKWDAADWILIAIADTRFFAGDFEKARQTIVELLAHSDAAIQTPFVHLRYGQIHFELGDLERAASELTIAYAAEGDEIFDGEDPKYFRFLSSRIRTF